MANGMPVADPSIIISAISAGLQAIQTWIAYRDLRKTRDALESEVASAATSDEIRQQAEVLGELIPAEVLVLMTTRVDLCWTRFKEVVGTGGYLPAEVDEAVDAAKKCICRELRRINQLNGSLPPGKLQEWWNQYCAA